MKLVLGIAALGVLVGAGSASAADLGGNCCADLEERIAELEATAARKGNRKVSLTVSGWVNEALFAWDDGVERDVYVGTNTVEQSRVRFVGEAKVTEDVAAGFTLEIGAFGGDSRNFSQVEPDGTNAGTTVVRKSNWWLKSKSLGKLTVGLEGTATYHLLDDADTTATRNFADAEASAQSLAAFRLRINGAPVGANLRWTDLLLGTNNDTPGQNGRRNIVRYDSPEFAGFVFTASWGEDDMWGGALTYKAKLGDFNLLAKAGYEKSTDERTSRCNAIGAPTTDDCEWWGAAATLQHEPTGLYVYGGYGQQHDDERQKVRAGADEDDRMWFIQGGLEQKWFPLGKTTIYGEYRNDDNGSNVTASPLLGADPATAFIQSSEIDIFGAGVVQKVDAAAMELYLLYRHTEGELTSSVGTKRDVDDFDMLITGARISF